MHRKKAEVVLGEHLKPFKDRIYSINMCFGEFIKNGIIRLDDNGKLEGIHPRWSQIFKVGPEIDWLQPGQWVLTKHGRWTRFFPIILDGETKKCWMLDPKDILLASDEKPKDAADQIQH